MPRRIKRKAPDQLLCGHVFYRMMPPDDPAFPYLCRHCGLQAREDGAERYTIARPGLEVGR